MEQAPLVLIGARSEARGRQLEQRLMDDGRVAILGVHTRAEPLLRAVMSSPSATLLLDTALEDATALSVLLRVLLRRPCPVVALSPALGGSHSLEMIRAGAIDCLVWDGSVEIAAALATSLVEASRTPVDRLQLVELPPRTTRGPRVTRPVASRVVLLIGSRRATLLCDALAHLPGDFPAAVMCCRPVHRSAIHELTDQLNRRTPLRVSWCSQSTLTDGGVYLFSPDDRLTVSNGGGRPVRMKMRRDATPSRSGLERGHGGLTWLDSMAASLAHRELDVVTVSSGHLDAATISILSRMLSIGVALARSVPGGYQIRWPGDNEATRADSAGFWHSLHARMMQRQASPPANREAAR